MIAPFRVQVRFADLDVMGHVNNTVYFSYLEMTRVHYFKELLGQHWDWEANGLLLARNSMDYIKSITLYDEPQIKMYTVAIGTKSFTLGYDICVHGEVFARAESVLVAYNRREQATIPIDTELRKALEEIMLDKTNK